MDSPATVAARMSLKRDHHEVCATKTSDNFSTHDLHVAASNTTSDIATARRETYDRSRSAHEASRSVFARLFIDAPPPSSPLSRLTVDTLGSPRKDLLTSSDNNNSGAPMSWPRANSRYSSNQTPPPLRLHTHQNTFETSPTGAPRSASGDFRQQLQEHQQQRFLLKHATTGFPYKHRQQQQVPEAEAESQDEVSMLREQVALLLKNLDDEKKRRMVEQKLMQEKIIELQGLIRRDFPEQQRAQERRLVQMRSPNAARSKLLRSTSKHSTKAQLSLSRKSSKSSDVSATSEEGDENNQLDLHQDHLQRDSNNNISNSNGDLKAASSPSGKALKEDAKAVESRMKKQLTKLRARMQAMVTDAQLESQNLRSQLQSEKQIADRKERQLRVETNVRMIALEERHSTAKKRLSEKVALLSLHVKQLLTENEMLAEQVKEKDARISRLELAVGGRLITESAFPTHQQRQQ